MSVFEINNFLERSFTSRRPNEFQSDDTGVRVLAYSCIIFPIIAFLSPVTIYYGVFLGRKDASENAGDAGEENKLSMPPLLVSSMFLNCFLFGIYAQYTGNLTLVIPNAAGAVLGLVFMVLYPFGMKATFRDEYFYQLGFVGLVGAFAAVALYGYGKPSVPSNVGMVIGVIMCCYPMPVMVRAVRTQDAGLLGSVWMNFAMLCCCSSWVVHASVVNFDHTVLIVNIVGVLVQTASLCIHVALHGKEPLDEGEVDLKPGGAREDEATESTPLAKG